MIPTTIVLFILGIIGDICWALQFLHVFILGKRNRTLFDFTKKFIGYRVKADSYFLILTDERNPIMPED